VPVATVVIAAYNAQYYIEKAVRSALEQTLVDIELVVVDDASSDATSSIVEAIQRSDARVRLHKEQLNLGKSEARNFGISLARGEWIAILDSDDWFAPERLQTLVALGEATSASVVVDNQNFVLDGDRQVWRSLFDVRRSSSRRIDAAEMVRLDMPGTNGTAGLLKPLIRRSFLNSNSIRYDPDMRTGEDFDFLMRCLDHCPHLQYVSKPMYNYRIRPDSDSRSRSSGDLEVIVTSNDRIVQSYSGTNAEAVMPLLSKRGRLLRNLQLCKKVAEAFQGKDSALTAAMVLRRPSVIPFALLLIARKAVGLLRFPKPRLARAGRRSADLRTQH